jgi:hypothetical protein
MAVVANQNASAAAGPGLHMTKGGDCSEFFQPMDPSNYGLAFALTAPAEAGGEPRFQARLFFLDLGTRRDFDIRISSMQTVTGNLVP